MLVVVTAKEDDPEKPEEMIAAWVTELRVTAKRGMVRVERMWVFIAFLLGLGSRVEVGRGAAVPGSAAGTPTWSAVGSWFLVLGSWFLVLGSWFLVHGSWFLVLGSWFLVLGSWLAAVRLSLIRHHSSAIAHPPSPLRGTALAAQHQGEASEP